MPSTANTRTQARRQRLLALLADGEFHSGEHLAKRLRISRGGVWKLIGTLRAMGIDIEALVYYALSLAWRGAVEEWKTLKGSNNYSLSRLLRGANPPKPRGTRVPTWRKTAPLEVD